MKDISLDLNPQEFEALLNKSVQLIIRTYKNLEHNRVFVKQSPSSIATPLDEPMPQDPTDGQSLWRLLEDEIVANATFSSGPHFYSYVLSPGNQMGLAADMISTFLNQNTSKWHLGPAAAELEKIALRWIAEFIGFPRESGGIFVSGGSMANLTCLTVARNMQAKGDINHQGLYGQAPMIIYLTDQAHYCVDKAMAILGLGRGHIRRIPTNGAFEMSMKDLEEAINQDLKAGLQPFCVVGSAGTVNTGAVDPLDEIASICHKYDLWFHVDAAYGGPAAGLAAFKESFKGMDRADSLALDPHKWFYVPIEAGCALFKDPQAQKMTFSLVPEYLTADRSADLARTDFMEMGPQLTRSFRALKVWMTFKAYGTRLLKENIAHDIEKARYLGSLLLENEDFEILAPPTLSIICFRLNPRNLTLKEAALDKLNLQLLHAMEEDGRIFITGTRIREKTALRVCIVNHRTQMRHIDHLMAVMKQLVKGLLQKT